MDKIDAHQHFWKYIPENFPWINSGMAVLQQDFLPEDLKKLLDAHQVTGCVAVQAVQNEGETVFLLNLADQFDFIKGVVGWVDMEAQNLEERLNKYVSRQKLKGFRHILQDEKDPDYILRPGFQKGLGLLQEKNYSYDILVFPHQMKGALTTIRKFPEMSFVLDHIAKPQIGQKPDKSWIKEMMEMGKYPNAYCKLSGMVTEATWGKWEKQDFVPFLEIAVEAFGTDRLMFGSDWPVCLLSASYGSTMEILEAYFQSFSLGDRKKIWAENAVQFYQL